MSPFSLLEHTADIGLEIHAVSLPALFAEAGLGLLAVLAPATPARIVRSRSIHIEGAEPAELLVGWLNEILFWLETTGLLPGAFEIRSATDRELRAVIRGEDLQPRHRLQREVKAATWHQLLLEPEGDGWFARLYLDL
jgi:SHS2 domain-containing protein